MKCKALFAVSTLLLVASARPAILRVSGCPASSVNGEVQTLDDRYFVSRPDGLVELDVSTDSCVSCHDGTVGAEVTVRSGREADSDSFRRGRSWAELGANHPVDVVYPEGDGKGDFVPKEMLDPRLRLIDGRVTCITCHGEDGKGSHLSIDNRGSRLCLSCHKR